MAISLAAWIITVLSFVFSRGKGRKIGRFLATGAILLCPTAAGAALGLLSCNRVQLNSVMVATLDGGGSYTSADARSLISVPLLASDPNYVCFSGSHKPAAWLAVATVACYVSALPFVLLLWLCRDPDLRRALAVEHPKGRRPHRLCLRCHRSVHPSSPAAPLADAGGDQHLEAPPPDGSDDSGGEAVRARAIKGSPDAPLPTSDPHLAPIVADSGYQVRYWWFRLLDLGATLVLAALQAFVPRPVTVAQVGG